MKKRPEGKKPESNEPEKRLKDVGRVLRATLFLSLVGLIISLYILYIQHSGNEGWCNISTGCHCDTVIKHRESSILGMPMALLSLQGYIVIIAATAILLRRHETEYASGKKLQIMNMMLGLTGFAYMTYFTYIQAYAIRSWCTLHALLYLIITAILILSTINYIWGREHLTLKRGKS